jgi:hypothetical protein
MIEGGNKIIEKGNNKINMFTGKHCPEMGMIQKGNQMIKEGNKIIEDSSKERTQMWVGKM